MILKKKLREGKSVMGTQITAISSPTLPWIMKNLGFDFLFIDCEHGGFTYREVSTLALMSKALDLGVLVRPPQADRQNIQIYADMGIDGLIIPMCESKEMVEYVVSQAKFPPVGVRGLAQGPVTDFKTAVDMKDLLESNNEEFMVIAQIESKAGVEHMDEIMAVDGVDACFFGMNDMSCSYGKPGQVSDPMFRDILADCMATAKKHGKIVGHHLFGDKDLQWSLEQGVQLISWRSDIQAMQATFRTDIAKVKGNPLFVE